MDPERVVDLAKALIALARETKELAARLGGRDASLFVEDGWSTRIDEAIFDANCVIVLCREDKEEG